MQMRRSLVLTLVAAVAAAALGITAFAYAAVTKPATVKTHHVKLGTILVNGTSHTLYLFEKDKHGKSSCAGQCAAFWPPLIASGKPLTTAGAKASLLGTTIRGDGRLQVTYNHHPLYTFVKDTNKGQTNGEELDAFGAEWYAISSAGSKVEKTDNQSSSSTDYPAPSGYGY
jgi:predicted lipoprotein with Yx(FWY)xxD motif